MDGIMLYSHQDRCISQQLHNLQRNLYLVITRQKGGLRRQRGMESDFSLRQQQNPFLAYRTLQSVFIN